MILSAPMPADMPRRYLILLAVVFLIAAFFRLARIAQPSLWMDEIWSIEMAMGHGSLHDHLPTNTIQYDQTELTDLHAATPWWNICTHLGGVTHPPLYFIVLRGWMDLFGTGAIAVRSLSVIFSLAALLVLFDLCRFLHGPKIALFAAAIFAPGGRATRFCAGSPKLSDADLFRIVLRRSGRPRNFSAAALGV